MAKTRSARTIKVSKENKAKLAKMFNCTDRMVYKALCFECDTELARKIQHVARFLRHDGGRRALHAAVFREWCRIHC